MVDEGNIFNSALWDISLQRLNQLGYFEEVKTEDAEVKPDPTEPESGYQSEGQEKRTATRSASMAASAESAAAFSV